jgi:DNA polymerase I-like protein with 3'-5' exonuclease and polymerase domains
MKSEYKLITKKKHVDKLITYVKQTGYCSFDFETNARPFHDPLFLPTIIGISFQPGSGYIIPLAHKDSPFKRKGIWLDILKKIGKELISNPRIIKVAWNASFELKVLKLYKIEVKGRLFDGIMAKYLLKEERPNGLKEQVTSLLPFFADYDLKGKPSSKAKREKIIEFWTNVELNELSKYCALDCDLTLRLMMFYEKLLLKHDFYKLFRNMLMMGTRVLSDSEYHGMPVDQKFLEGLVVTYGERVIELEKELYKHPIISKFEKGLVKDRVKKYIFKIETEIEDIEIEMKEMDANYRELVLSRDNEAARRVMNKINAKAKLIKSREEKIDRIIAHDFRTKGEQKMLEKVNFASPEQMVQLFHKSPYGFRFKVVKYTVDEFKKETDRPSTDEEVLTELMTKDKSGFIERLLEFRGTSKLYSTYIVGMKDILSVDSRIHPSYLLFGTVTGRLSSINPNFQNIPRDTTNADIKKMFIPPKNKILLQLDYSQAELRVMAAQANETEMLRWFREGRDIHLAVACDKNKWDYEWALPIYLKEDKADPNYTKIKVERKYAKTINFGIIYGQTANKLSIGMGTSIKEAEIYLKEYNKRFPNIAKFIKKQNAYAERHGFVKNIFGRKRRLPNIWHSEWGKKAEAQRQSVNAPIQGAASDYTLFSSILIWEKIRKGELPKDMIQCYTVHDSLGFFLDPKDVHWVVPILDEICSNPETMEWFGFQIDSVKMQVDFEVSHISWAKLSTYHKNEDYIKPTRNFNRVEYNKQVA